MVPACSGWCSIPVIFPEGQGLADTIVVSNTSPDKALFQGPAD